MPRKKAPSPAFHAPTLREVQADIDRKWARPPSECEIKAIVRAFNLAGIPVLVGEQAERWEAAQAEEAVVRKSYQERYKELLPDWRGGPGIMGEFPDTEDGRRASRLFHELRMREEADVREVYRHHGFNIIEEPAAPDSAGHSTDRDPEAPVHIVEPKGDLPRGPEQPGAKRFRVALSFPGEKREFLCAVADHLAATIGQERVFYDEYYKAELARPDLDTYLQGLYHDDSDLIAVFLCADYDKKEWCHLEWRAIRDMIKRREAAAIMLFRFDDTEVPGLFSIDGYVSVVDLSAHDVAALILKRLESNAREA